MLSRRAPGRENHDKRSFRIRLAFDDPESRLPAIDRLEDFDPGGSGVYRRVLVHVTVPGAREPAWVYTVEASGVEGRRIASGRWPE